MLINNKFSWIDYEDINIRNICKTNNYCVIFMINLNLHIMLIKV